MIVSLHEKRLSTTMLKHFVLINLLYPVFTSSVGSAYSPDFVLANLFAVLFMVAAALEGNIQWKKKSFLAWGIGIAMVGFNIFAFYVNWSFFQWYAGQINVTISFAFFAALLLAKGSAAFEQDDFVKFLLGAVVVTNLVGVIPWFFGYSGTMFSDGIMRWIEGPYYSEYRYSWVYLHKSEYSFMLILFVALTVTYRHLFQKKWMFYGSIGVFIFGLAIANTRTTMLAALFIFAGCLADYVREKMGGFSWKMLWIILPVIALGAGMLMIFAKDKNIWTLGGRVRIWAAALGNVLDNPWGTGQMCGLQRLYTYLPKYGKEVGIDNCHNVFLNILLQFSIPAGFFYVLALVGTALAAIYRNWSFRTLGICIAALTAMMMDWCILLPQVSMMLLVFYMLFFRQTKPGIRKK